MTIIDDEDPTSSTSTSIADQSPRTKNGKGKRIILFKTSQPTSSEDLYYLTLRKNGYKPNFISVLKEEYDTASLETLIRGGDEGEGEEDVWEGIVITSRRGAEGWVKAVRSILNQEESSEDKRRWKWNDIPLFSVGTSSSELITQADIPNYHKPKLQHQFDNNGRPAKSAGELARMIIDTPPRTKNRKKAYGKYLFICGDKALDELPFLLTEKDRDVVQIVVYHTTPRKDIASQLEDVMRKEGKEGWLAFFSPSSAGYVLPHLEDNLSDHAPVSYCQEQPTAQSPSRLPRNTKDEEGYSLNTSNAVIPWTSAHRWANWKIFAIGETTAKYLRGRGIHVDAVAKQPSAEGMMEAILDVDGHGGKL